MDKPVFEIDLFNGGRAGLEALDVLIHLAPTEGLHDTQNHRPPLGIYNTSILRISERLLKCCEKYSEYFNYGQSIKQLREVVGLKNDAIESLEYALYAAAEHVDDLKLIVHGFFSKGSKSNILRRFKDDLNDQKKLITTYVNQIKHYQARLRGFSLELIYGGEHLCLHGVFVEGVAKGIAGPNKTVHGEKTEVVSVTSLIWEIICFLLCASRSLNTLISAEVDSIQPQSRASDCQHFRKAVIAAAKLPLYTFDDVHPLSKTNIKFKNTHDDHESMSSELIGSFYKGWPKDDNAPMYIGTEVSYQGDSVTASFKAVSPSNVGFIHWVND